MAPHHTKVTRPRVYRFSHLILPSSQILPLHPLHPLQLRHLHPINRAYINRQLPLHEGGQDDGGVFGFGELVNDGDAAGGAEGVVGEEGGELVGGYVVAVVVVEGDGLLGGVRSRGRRSGLWISVFIHYVRYRWRMHAFWKKKKKKKKKKKIK